MQISDSFITPDDFVVRFFELVNDPTSFRVFGLAEYNPSDVAQLPSKKHVAKLVVEAWKASLQSEEGRPTRLRIKIPTSKFEFHESPFLFTEYREFTAKEIVRLAPAIGTNLRSLLVSCQGPDLKILGVLDDWLHYMLKRVDLMATGLRVIFPEHLELVILGASRLQLRFLHITLEYNAGTIREFVTISQVEPLKQFFESLAEEKGDGDSDIKYIRQSIFEHWTRLLRNVRQVGHGGTLLIQPKEGIDRRLSIKYEVRSAGI